MCNAGPRAYIQHMSAHCCGPEHHTIDPNRGNEGYRRVLWAVLAINAIQIAEVLINRKLIKAKQKAA